MVPPDSDRVSRVPSYSGYRQAVSGFRLRGYHPLWPHFPECSAIHPHTMWRSHNPGEQAHRFGLIRVRSPLLTESLLISFPVATKMFQFATFASTPYVFRCRYRASTVGFPIRTPPDQSLLTGSPKLFAGSHVLHRRSAPRHPPWALVRLTNATLKHWNRESQLEFTIGANQSQITSNESLIIINSQLVKNDQGSGFRIQQSGKT